MRLAVLFGAAALACGLGAGALAAPSAGGSSAPSAPAGNFDPARAYQEGVEALRARDYARAVSRLRRVVDAAPRDGAVNYVYALALIGNGDESEARRPLERAARADNAPPDALNQLGQLHLRAGDRAAAQAQAATLHTMLQGCDAACGDARRAQIQAAHDALSAALAAPAAPAGNPSMSWLSPSTAEGRVAYAYAVGLINAERWADALVALERARAAIGPHPDILNYMGFANRHLARHDAAIGYYREALALDPDHLGANEYLGELYLELGRAGEARAQLARLDRLCPYGCAEREELARWIALAAN